jgi:hypothetical protein
MQALPGHRDQGGTDRHRRPRHRVEQADRTRRRESRPAAARAVTRLGEPQQRAAAEAQRCRADIIVHRLRRTAAALIAAAPARRIAFGVACRRPLDGRDLDVEVDDDGLLPEHLPEAWSWFGYASALYAGPGMRVGPPPIPAACPAVSAPPIPISIPGEAERQHRNVMLASTNPKVPYVAGGDGEPAD